MNTQANYQVCEIKKDKTSNNHILNHRETITCDIDGILTDYPACWLNYLGDRCGTYYSSTQEARKSEKNYSIFKDEYRESEYKASLPINKSNRDALIELSKKYDIIFTTSRPINDIKYPHLFDNTYNWLLKNGLKFSELRYKDEDADFLNDLDIVFHIDDELKYANSIIKKSYDLGKETCTVYLISNESIPFDNCGNIVPVKTIQEIVEEPFFSVCIPSTNRGDTIYRALSSVANQKFRNFEVVVVDCESEDNTAEEVERFFESNEYQQNKFRFRFIKKNYKPIGTEDWNDPIKSSTGKYIAMLEGDDYWLSDHLENAYASLSDNTNVGIYGSSNTYGKRRFQGLLSNVKAKKYCFVIKDGAVPPSESVFIRLNRSGNPFLYNSDDYKYSPEIALYVDITLDGFDIYYSHKQDVYREPSTNPDKLKTWYYFADRFTLIDKYKKHFDNRTIIKSKTYNAMITITYAIRTHSFSKCKNLIKSLSEKIGWQYTILSALMCGIKLLVKCVLYFPRKLKRVFER